MRKKISEAERRQKQRVQISLKLDPKNDADIIEILSHVHNKQGMIKSLLRDYKYYMKKNVDWGVFS